MGATILDAPADYPYSPGYFAVYFTTAEGGSGFRDQWFGEGHAETNYRQSLSFDKIVDAHRYFEASGQVGKIVVTM